MEAGTLEGHLTTDATHALRYYGETLRIRRPGLQLEASVKRVRLIYEGGKLKPRDSKVLEQALSSTSDAVPGVEMVFQ